MGSTVGALKVQFVLHLVYLSKLKYLQGQKKTLQENKKISN